MTKAKPSERAPIARMLRDDGLSQKEIADRLGVSIHAINHDLNPRRRCPSLRQLAVPGRDA